jgi:uncharacterized membrane protein
MTTVTTPLDSTQPITKRRAFGVWWVISVLLALSGLVNTGYLVITKLMNTEVYCPPSSTWNCDLVQNSMYAQLAGIPIQYLGLVGYAAIFGVLILEPRTVWFGRRGKLLVFGMTLLGFLYSAYLTAIEAFVLQAWCTYCVVSAVTMTLLFVIAFVRVWRSLQATSEGEEEEALA